MENSQNRIKIKETIIVEGKYDKIRLSPLFDANIIELGGFQIYNNKDRLALIRRIADKNGIIILTDSDSAGFRLRHYLSSAIPKANIKNVFKSVKGWFKDAYPEYTINSFKTYSSVLRSLTKLLK